MENISNAKIIFMGTPEFAVPSLKKLIKNFNILGIVTNEGDTPVKKAAEENKIPVFQPEKLEIENWKLEIPSADLYVVAAYGKIIPKSIFNIPRLGTINVHASLLPRWRGSSPIQYAILNNDAKTGVTIIKINEKVDQGPILSQQEVLINPKDTYLTLSKKLAEISADILIETIQNLLQNKITPKDQNELEATYTKILTKDDGKIIWSKKAEEIERQTRAFDPWPGSFTFFKRHNQLVRMKILQVDIAVEDKSSQMPFGQIFLTEERRDLVVKTGSVFIKINELQLEGGRILKAKEFLTGYPEIIGQVLF